MGKRRILVVEDDTAIRTGIVDALDYAGYEVMEARDGHEGLKMATTVSCELILLDLIMPGPDGFEVLQAVREGRPTLPVIILTAMGEEDHRVRGLKEGADDYVVKPFSIKELLARIEAVLRRSPERPVDVDSVQIPGGCIDLNRCEVTFDDGERADLSEREIDLIRYLASNSGRAVTRDEILQRVWRLDPQGVEKTRTIDMHIARLREKLRDNGDTQIIQTVRGKGYRFTALTSEPS